MHRAQTAPSPKELTKKLREALASLEAGNYGAIEPNRHLVNDMVALKSADADEHMGRVAEFLKEIFAAGGAKCYSGHPKQPPTPCTHPPFDGRPLYYFTWYSPSIEKKMYLKFLITYGANNAPKFQYLTCHEQKR